MTLNSNSRLLVTGGTGSFGREFIREVLNRYPEIERLVIFSRDELKQWEMQNEFPSSKYPQLRFFLGDIRNKDRLLRAIENIDIVIHAAALKQVPAAEYNPIEFIKTNVIGAENLVQACLDSDVKKVIALSTDKAAAPVNLYGATKLCSDKLFTAANNIVGRRKLSFSIVRYGNVLGSRGSVIPFFIKKAKEGNLPITHTKMTRFSITLSEGVEMVFRALQDSLGGEIFVPKIPSYNIMDLKEAIAPSVSANIVGLRPGEKIHEELITSSDSINCVDLGDYYSVLSPDSNLREIYRKKGINFENVQEGFNYNSGMNKNFLSVEEIRNLIKKNIDPDFNPI